MRHLSRTAVALAVGSAISMGAQADILITEYVEGSSYNKAIEITNTGSDDVNLADGYVVGLATNGKSESEISITHQLYGVLKANESIVLVNSKASDELKAKGVVSSTTNFNGDDAIVIKKGNQIVDSFGQLGTDPGSLWGAGDTATQNKTLRRSNLTPRTNASETFEPSAYFSGHEIDSFDDLQCTNEAFCSGEKPVEPTPAFECKAEDGSEPTFTSINAIQGSGDKSPLITSGFITDGEYFVKGVVTARGESLFKGFYLQALDADGLDTTSDGLFIFTDDAPGEDIQPGVEVCVKGKVQENFNLTQLASSNSSYKVTATGGSAPAPQPLVIKEGETLRDALERYEGMNIRLDADSDLRVTRNFSFDYDSYRSNMVLAHKTPLIKPTQLYPAESDKATALRDSNIANQLFIESDFKAKNGEIPYFADFNPDDGYIRVGDRVENLEGVVGYSYDQYRLVPTNQLTTGDFVRNELVGYERKDQPELKDASIKVASFNVLNFFTSHSSVGGVLNRACDDQADADAEKGCNRGAKDYNDFLLQRTKIVNAMKTMDADVIGIMEMENNGFGTGSAIKDLVDTLNKEFSKPADFYTYVEISDTDAQKYAKEGAEFEGNKYFGTDSIMVAMIYRPAKVTPAKAAQVIVTPEQHAEAGKVANEKGDEANPAYDKYQRHSLVQAFNVPGQKEPLNIVVNHFKSKGSECVDNWQNGDVSFYVKDKYPKKEYSAEQNEAGVTYYKYVGKGNGTHDKKVEEPADLQGKCTEFRVAAAKVVGDAAKSLKGDVLVIGDMNAYGQEDPLLVLTEIPEGREIKTSAFTTVDGIGYPQVSVSEGAGLINLLDPKVHPEAFSYSYGGELGSLDHALANQSLKAKVRDITDWHINSIENSLFEYTREYSGDLAKSENAFSASDHDPVIISLAYKGVAEGVKVKPARKGESATLPVAVSSTDVGKYIQVTLDAAPAAKLKSFSNPAQTEAIKVTHQVTQAEADSGSADVALPAELATGDYQAELALYDQDPSSVSGQTPADLGSATISVEKAVSSSTPEPTPTNPTQPTTAPASSSSSGGSFGFGALLALAGLGWTRRRRT